MFSWRRKADPTRATSAPRQARPAAAHGVDRLLRELEWTVLRRLDGVLQGDYRTLFRGSGLDLADLREYQAHDDVRHIDWNVTARTGVAHVREFHEDREIAAWFLLDLSASVGFGSGATSKRDLSVAFVATIARLLGRHGNRVGAMLYAGGEGAFVPPRAGRRHLLHVLDQMLRTDAQPGSRTGPTDLGIMLRRAAATIRRRSLVFVVSDFISVPGWQKPLAELSRRHEVVAVRLFDPLEVSLPDLGLVVLQDAETHEQVFVDTRDAGFRARFETLSSQREQALRDGFSGAGVDCLELSTDEPLDAALLRFSRLRRQRSQLASGIRHLAKGVR